MRDMSAFVFAVAAAVVREGRVLAMRRAAHKDAGAGLWETVSGRVAPDEQPLDAIAREIAEETGLDVEVDARPVDSYVARRGQAPMCVVFYRARWRGGEVQRSDEHDAHRWVSADELEALGSPPRLVEAVRLALRVESQSATS